jgi:hypothetical protein
MNFFKHILSHVKQWFSSPHTLADEAHSASMALKIVAPGLIFALQSAGIDDPKYIEVTTEIEKDLDTLETTLEAIAEGKPPAVTVVSIIQSIKVNLQPILDLSHVKNPDLRAKITNAYNAFEAEVEVISAEFGGVQQ